MFAQENISEARTDQKQHKTELEKIGFECEIDETAKVQTRENEKRTRKKEQIERKKMCFYWKLCNLSMAEEVNEKKQQKMGHANKQARNLQNNGKEIIVCAHTAITI